jgi:O-antigen ligase/tetratricopeptide (TPR) repeat protein
MSVLPILILGCLAVLGAGLVPGVTPPMAVALLAVACVRPLPTQDSFRACVWLLLALTAWALFTLLPAGVLAGPWRTAAWADIQAFAVQHGSRCGLSPVGPTVPRLSLHAGGTLRWLMLMLGAGGMVCLTASLRTQQRVATIKALVVLGALVAAAGMVGRSLIPSGDALVWWYPVAEIGGGSPFGPFVNRNHFAGFCALLAPLALALACPSSGPFRETPSSSSGADDEAPLNVSPGGRLLYGACLIVLLTAVLCSHSRGGSAAALLGLIVVALLWMRRGMAAAVFATLASVGAILLVALWPDAEFQGRLHGMRDTATALGARWPVWLDSVRLWSRAPLAGCGANGFGMLFPQVTTWATGQQATHAESDVMQSLAEGGLFGTLLLAATVGACCLPLARTLLPRRQARRKTGLNRVAEGPSSGAHPRLPYPLLAGVGAALTACAFQSLVDIPLRVPLCAWTVAALAGLASPSARRHRGTAPVGRARAWPERLALGLLLATSLCICWRGPGWRALYRDRDAWLAEAASADLVGLLRETPTYWQAWYEIGDRLCVQATGAVGPEAEALRAAGWEALRAACRCNPRDPRLHGAFAARLWAAEQWDEARLHLEAQCALLPADRGIRQRWLEAEWRAGATEYVGRLAQRFAEARPGDPAAADYLVWLAEREMAEGSIVRARTALLKAAALRPGEAQILKGLAQCARRLGDVKAEADWLQRLVRVSRADAATWWRLAEFARDAGDRRALEEALGMAVQSDPSRRRAADEAWKSFVQRSAARSP